MKIFISWSGSPSKQIAEVFHEWIPSVVQSVVPFLSSADTQKGARWAGELAQQLEHTDFGILCITPANVDAPWINFEAGALSKVVDTARVSPVLFGLQPSDITNPLVQFQCTAYDHDDLLNLFRSINGASENGLDAVKLENAFEMWWPNFDAKIVDVLKNSKHTAAPRRHPDDMIVEILALAREHQKAIAELEYSSVDLSELRASLDLLRRALDSQKHAMAEMRLTASGYVPVMMNIANSVNFTELSFTIGQLLQAADYAANPGNENKTASFTRIRGLLSILVDRLSPILDIKVVESIRRQNDENDNLPIDTDGSRWGS
jgi:TIR domain